MSGVERPRILVIGETGQVGWELIRTLTPLGDVRSATRQAIDLANLESIGPAIRAWNPTVIVNAAAYTNVEGAEADEAVAHRINGDAPGILAEEAKRLGAVLMHYSTDYVFDGSQSRAYIETDCASPINAYGRSKLAGEEAINSSGADAYTFRVSWVYGLRGRNFLGTMRRLSRSERVIRVVADQYGAPTWSRTIAEATAATLSQILKCAREGSALPPRGVYHMTAPDFTTWHEFAQTIIDSDPRSNSLAPEVQAISTDEYPTAAKRPRSSVLSSQKLNATFGVALPSWRDQFRQCMSSDV